MFSLNFNFHARVYLQNRKRRTNNKPSEALKSQENGRDELTYAAIVKPRGDQIREPKYANCQPYRNQDEELYADVRATKSHRPQKEDDEVIYCEVEVVNEPSKRITKTKLEDTVYAKLAERTGEPPEVDEIIYQSILNLSTPLNC